MKRTLFVCCLIAFTCIAPFIQNANAQLPTVSLATFTTKVNQLDAYITAGNMTKANIAADDVNQTMMIVAAKSKIDYNNATLPADKAHYLAINNNQMSLYHDYQGLRPDLTTNQAAIHTKLVAFGATIY